MIRDKVSHSLFNEATVNFVYDETVPLNCAYWDTVNVYKKYKNLVSLNKNISELNFNILYNIPSESCIRRISENVDHIYRNYIIEKENPLSLRIYPEINSVIPTWVTFNPEKKMFCFESSVFFDVLINKSSIDQCSYITMPNGLSQTSDYYEYANSSKTCVCSNPIFYKANSVSTCNYMLTSNFAMIKQCTGYLADRKVLFTNLLTHKISKKSLKFTTVVYRDLEDAYKIEVYNVTNNSTVSILNYKSMAFNKNKTVLYQEAKNHLIELLKIYEEDYNIEWNQDDLIDNVSFVSIKVKNSYISNLIPKDSYGNQRSELFQTV